MCYECRVNGDGICPQCREPLKVTAAGWFCPECGYLRRVVSEETMAFTEVRKPGEKGAAE